MQRNETLNKQNKNNIVEKSNIKSIGATTLNPEKNSLI